MTYAGINHSRHDQNSLYWGTENSYVLTTDHHHSFDWDSHCTKLGTHHCSQQARVTYFATWICSATPQLGTYLLGRTMHGTKLVLCEVNFKHLSRMKSLVGIAAGATECPSTKRPAPSPSILTTIQLGFQTYKML